MTAFREASEAALDVARARHQAILGGDFERYASLSDELSASCEVLEQAAGDGDDRSVFDELAALESASLRGPRGTGTTGPQPPGQRRFRAVLCKPPVTCP